MQPDGQGGLRGGLPHSGKASLDAIPRRSYPQWSQRPRLRLARIRAVKYGSITTPRHSTAGAQSGNETAVHRDVLTNSGTHLRRRELASLWTPATKESAGGIYGAFQSVQNAHPPASPTLRAPFRLVHVTRLPQLTREVSIVAPK